MLGKWVAAVVLTVSLFVASSIAFAQEKSAVRQGFTSESLNGQKILLFRPSVWVGAQSTGGMPEPNADWTAQAREFLNKELARRQIEFSNELVIEPDLVGDDAKLFSEHRALFSSVANSVVNYQFFAGNRLPTRKDKPFEWTLGEGTKAIAEKTGAKYGLFVTTEDQYGSLGRKMFQFLAAGLIGASVKSGEHVGYAGLVDLETGNLVWLNADEQMGGDVRTEDGMQKRVEQLLEDFPGLKSAAAAVK